MFPDIDQLALRLRGHRLPGGEYLIGDTESRQVARLSGHEAPQPHPVFSSVVTLKALGVTIEQLCALCEFRLEDGPMLGEFTTRFLMPLEQDVRYTTEATIESIDRTYSARAGVLDRLRFAVRICLPNGSVAVEVRYLWLLPRGKAEQ
jgi:hypothetical protein